MPFEARTIGIGRGKEVALLGVESVSETVTLDNYGKSYLNGGDVAVAAHLRYKPSAGLESSLYAGQHCVLIVHPVQSGIGKHGIKFGMERKCLGVAQVRIETTAARCLNHGRRSIEANNFGSCGIDAGRQLSVAAAQIEYAIARLWIEPFEHSRA
jgi:hypothetical protein